MEVSAWERDSELGSSVAGDILVLELVTEGVGMGAKVEEFV